MITLRNTASAFLTNGQDILLMKRSESKKLNPGTWASIGGHIEADEFDSPQRACLREIYEETGIAEGNIRDLKLKYIILRREENKIGVQYIYFGNTDTRILSNTDEGQLFWIDKQSIFERQLPVVSSSVLHHYFETGNSQDDVFVGIVYTADNEAKVKWNILNDLSMITGSI